MSNILDAELGKTLGVRRTKGGAGDKEEVGENLVLNFHSNHVLHTTGFSYPRHSVQGRASVLPISCSRWGPCNIRVSGETLSSVFTLLFDFVLVPI